MAAGGDDAGGDVGEALAPEVRGQDLAGVDAAAVQVGEAVSELTDTLAPGGGAELELELDLGEGGMERLDGGRDDGLHPQRRRGDGEAPGALPGRPSGGPMVKTAEVAGRR